MRLSNLLVSKVLAHIGSRLRPGVSGITLDKEAEEMIRDYGGVPGFKGYRGYPNTLCVSINEVVVHGIPSDIPFKEKDIVSVDCGVLMNGFYGDAAYTFAIGDVSPEVLDLLRVTKTSLYLGIAEAKVGSRLGDISFAIQDYTERDHPYAVVRELVGHGVGKSLHEDPEVPNYGKRGNGPVLKDGMVLAIEPMINLGKKGVSVAKDDWTIFTKDRLPSAHYEHSVAIRYDGPDILSDHKIIEIEILNNPELKPVELMPETSIGV
jgi:methionyl aminopeptidase